MMINSIAGCKTLRWQVGIYLAICTDNVADKETAKPGEASKELLKYDTHGSITIVPTADDNGMDYTCEASHPAIPIDRPMRATIKLSVFCECDSQPVRPLET